MATQVAEPEAPEETQVTSPLRDIVTQMVAMRDQLEAEEKDLFEKANATKVEREQIDKMIKASGTKKATTKAASKKADIFAPREMPTHPRSLEAITKCIGVIVGFDGEQFQVSQVERETGCNRTTVARAIGVMRGEDRLRVLGKRPPMARGSYPGGSHALTFKEIKS